MATLRGFLILDSSGNINFDHDGFAQCIIEGNKKYVFFEVFIFKIDCVMI